MRIITFISFCLLCSISAVWHPAYTQEAPTTIQDSTQALSVIRGTLKVPGLQHPVKVLRDHWGVAHIYAQNQHDLFFAQGFIAAQDRLFQMELWKRSGARTIGRSTGVLGAIP